ncbi:polysaccharide lyase [Aeromicrobium massiliense]|uniref:polysaccharide lyase n=1 Tax=Aeromicrobium massiliense TaxID=1464554 RepID=UPI0002F972A9|nr:polysaccharide lyase [Aeromicrobium massiliense]
MITNDERGRLRRRLLTRGLALALLGATLSAAPAPAAPALSATADDPVWSGDFETGDRKQWDGEHMVDEDRLQVTGERVRHGRYALKATVRQGDDPINSSGNRNELKKMTDEPSGSEYYYRWSTLFPASFPSERTWQLFAQWHHHAENGSPPVEFYVFGEEIRLNIGGSPGKQVWKTPLVREKWNDFVFHVKWSADAEVGFVELFHNGRLVVPKQHIATQFPGLENYLKIGLYRNDTIKGEGVVYHDDWAMGRTLASVTRTPARPTPAPKPPAPAPAKRFATKVSARLADSTVRRGRGAKVVARVTGRAAVAGRVRLLVDGRHHRTATLHGGKVRLRISKKLRPGRHVVRVVYLGSRTAQKSSSRAMSLRVSRRR